MVCSPTILVCVLPFLLANVLVLAMAGAFAMTATWVFIESVVGVYMHILERKDGGPVGRQETGTRWSNPGAVIPGGNFLIIVPAYLNNEADILPSTLDSYTKLQYKGGTLTVQLVFNCRNADSEAMTTAAYELARDWHGQKRGDCIFEVHHNKQSKSKAQNVNYVLDRIHSKPNKPDYIGVFDADHWPTRLSVQHAAHRFREGQADIIQGHCSVRNYSETLVASIVAVEFEDIYNIGHEGRTDTWDIGIFGGSNGYWRAPLLIETQMDGSMLTEDIDSSFRALRKGAQIRYCHMMRSSELATESMSALIKQRARWSQGWFEVSKKHFIACFISRTDTLKSVRKKICIILLLFYREIFPYLTVAPGIFLIILYLREGYIYLNYALLYLFIVMMSMNILRLAMVCVAIQGPVRSDPHWFARFMLYAVIYLPYQGLLNTVQVSSHWRNFAGKTEWVVTSRGRTGEAAGAVVRAKRAVRRPSFKKRFSFIQQSRRPSLRQSTDESIEAAIAEAVASMDPGSLYERSGENVVNPPISSTHGHHERFR